MSSSIDENGNRLYLLLLLCVYYLINDRYRVNGNPIMIRGGGWSPDLFLRTDPIRQASEFDYVIDILKLN